MRQPLFCGWRNPENPLSEVTELWCVSFIIPLPRDGDLRATRATRVGASRSRRPNPFLERGKFGKNAILRTFKFLSAAKNLVQHSGTVRRIAFYFFITVGSRIWWGKHLCFPEKHWRQALGASAVEQCFARGNRGFKKASPKNFGEGGVRLALDTSAKFLVCQEPDAKCNVVSAYDRKLGVSEKNG